MTRSTTATVSDYQKLTKANKFSPSPIKRYAHKSNLYTDDKENIGLCRRSIFQQKFKRPYPILKKKAQTINNVNVTARDHQIIRPLQSCLLVNIPRQEYLKEQKLQNQDSKNMITNISNKRQEKQQSKEISKFSKLNKDSVTSRDLDKQDEVPSSKSDASRTVYSAIINQNLDKYSELPMDATYLSSNSLLGGVQFQGRWTQEEHQKFVEGLKLFGKDWKKIEDHIGSRTCAQIRSHAQKYFNRLHRNSFKHKQHQSPAKPEPVQPKTTKPQQVPESQAIKSSTNRQLQMISDTFSKLAEEDLSLMLQQKLAEREEVCQNYLTKSLNAKDACQQLIALTNDFHQLGMQALANYKSKFLPCDKDISAVLVDMCNRMIDERNITQLICVLLSQHVIVMPDLASYSGALHNMTQNIPALSKDFQPTHGTRETARTSPKYDTHTDEDMHIESQFTHDDHQTHE